MFKFFRQNRRFSIFLVVLFFILFSAWWEGCPIFGPWTPSSPNTPLGDTPFSWHFYDANISSVDQSTDLVLSLTFTFLLLVVGLIGVWCNDRNVLILMLCIELILLSSTLNFVIFSILWYDPAGQIYALAVLTVAACESAVGLGLLISAYCIKENITFESFRDLKS